METETKTLVDEMVMVGEFEKGPESEPIEVSSFEEFESLFGRYDGGAILGVPDHLANKFLTYVRTKISFPLSEIVEKIKLRNNIEKTINEFLDENTQYTKDEMWEVINRLTKMVKQYTSGEEK